jgi:hypothetical protein
MSRRVAMSMAAFAFAVAAVRAQQAPGPAAPQAPQGQGRSTNLGADANGNPLRLALKTGHVSNYDESKVPPYTLPDPLKLADGSPVRDAKAWMTRQRPALIRLYEAEIFGHVPATAPKVRWAVSETNAQARDGAAIMKRIVGTIGTADDAPRMQLVLHTPAKAKGPVPVILIVNFGGGQPPPADPSAPRPSGPPLPTADPPVAAEILEHGWGYATIGYQDIQPDRANAWMEGVVGRAFVKGQDQPRPEEWGTIGAWAWGISRMIDYLETDRSVDGTRIAVQGHSRLGKTVLWASARDERIVATFSSCAGEMGSALSRRDWGETVDDMAQNFPYWFSGTFQKWVGRWNEMPVDAHTLIALSAPRGVFLTGGTKDQWADPVGEFLAASAAGPVYRLLGKKDLGVSELPPLDKPLTSGDLGWHYHTGAHTATREDWMAFLDFVRKYFD